jgi:hypothetical protein
MKRIALLALAAALVGVASCGTPKKDTTAANLPAACAAARNASEVNTIIQSAEQNITFLQSNAARLTSISTETAGAAPTEARPQDKIRCYGLSLRAAGALFRNAGSEDAALTLASTAAIDGTAACDAFTATLDAGVTMDCSRIRVWRFTLATLKAVQDIEAKAKTPPGVNLPSETWPPIKASMVRVGENVTQDWKKTDNAQEAKNHRTRTACRYYLQSTRVRGAFGLLNRSVMDEYNAVNEPIIDALVEAVPVTAQDASCAAGEAATSCLEKRRKSFSEGCRAMTSGG